MEIASGKQHREHEDVDLCILRADIPSVLTHFADWEIQVAIPVKHRLIPCNSVEDEWQLLFKAKDRRSKDEEDFLTHGPHLDAAGKQWLLSSLLTHLPDADWIPHLQEWLSKEN